MSANHYIDERFIYLRDLRDCKVGRAAKSNHVEPMHCSFSACPGARYLPFWNLPYLCIYRHINNDIHTRRLRKIVIGFAIFVQQLFDILLLFFFYFCTKFLRFSHFFRFVVNGYFTELPWVNSTRDFLFAYTPRDHRLTRCAPHRKL